MKLLYLPAYSKPELVATSNISDNRNHAFIDAGFRIEAYTPTPCRGLTLELRKKYKKKEYRIDTYYGGYMILHRFPLFSEGNNAIIRAFRYVCCWFIHFYKGLQAKNVDCIYLASTPPIQGMLGALLKKIKKVPFVYNLQDIFPDSLVAAGMTHKGSILWKIGRVIENFTYKNADKIIVISEDFKRNIMAKGVPEEKIVVIYNWVDENAVVPVAKGDNPLYEQFGISRDKFHVVYAGNLGNAQNIDVIIDTAAKLRDREDIEFVIFGSGGSEAEIKSRISKEGLHNVKMFPLQPAEMVSFVYSLGDLCIVSCKAGFGGSAMPSKTWSILSTGRPVLANFDEGELKQLLETNNCGIFTKAGDAEGMANAIVEACKHKEHCDEMGRNGREFVLKNLTKEVGTQKYVDVIKSVVK